MTKGPEHSRSGTGRVVMASSRQVEYSLETPTEDPGQRTSVFTAALVEGLRTGAADLDGDGQISTTELYGYIQESLELQGARQTPQYRFEGSGEIYIAKAGRRVGAFPAAKPTLDRSTATGTPHRPVAVPRYSPELLDADDELGFEPAADALADLIASRQLTPPLAIGLFGDWGAGKSFFMSLVKRRIETLAAAAGTAPGEEVATHVTHVVHLRFNAWHYVDANMWASLATRIFQGIAEYLETSSGSLADAHRVLLGQLQSSQLLLKDAEQRQAAAEESLAEAQHKISTVRLEQQQRSVGQLRDRHPEASGAVADLSSDLGIDVQASVTSVRERIRELRETSNVFTGLITLLGVQASARARLRTFAVPIVLLLVGMVTAAALYAAHRIGAARLAPWISVVVAAGSALAAAARKTARIVRSGAELLGIDTLDEELALASAREAAEKAGNTLRDVQRQFDELGALDATGVYRFVSERYASPDYARYMGVASLIEQDLQALSRLLTASGPDRPVERGGRQMRVDRMVLYVDDLDRCPAGTVLEVLQAVHLLLSLPLFVVVVGVDSNWLLGALRTEYDEITRRLDGYQQTMPLSYLEKIFQIPFWVPMMDDVGYRRLIGSLVDPHSGPHLPGPVDAPPAPSVGGATSISDGRSVPDAGATPGTGAVAGTAPAPEDRSWTITPQEAAFLAELGGFVRTPRAVKRLTNIYRLLKAASSAADRAALDGDGEFRVALTLAAIATGFAEQTPAIFGLLRGTTGTSWQQFLDVLREQAVLEPVVALLDGLGGRLGDPGLAVVRRWAPRVLQFSFADARAGSTGR